jgi:transcriptional regulator CtsR
MGNNLADFIERCILGKFLDARDEYIMMRRNDLAIELSCAPSQISYVLNTRFTPERGFVVKSRRGAGGFVRIIRMPSFAADEAQPQSAAAALDSLLAGKVVSRREYALLAHLLEISAAQLDDEGQSALLQEALKRLKEFS